MLKKCALLAAIGFLLLTNAYADENNCPSEPGKEVTQGGEVTVGGDDGSESETEAPAPSFRHADKKDGCGCGGGK